MVYKRRVCFFWPIPNGPYTDAVKPPDTSFRYKQVHNALHAESSMGRRRRYNGTILILDSDGEQADDEREGDEDGVEDGEPLLKKPKVSTEVCSFAVPT